jgi:hypothetical protein
MAEIKSISENPWQIFKGHTKYIPLYSPPWTGVPDSTNLYDDIDDSRDEDYIVSPDITYDRITSPTIFTLDKFLAPGEYSIKVRARKTATYGQVRSVLLDSYDRVVGTSNWQGLTNSFNTYSLPVTTSETAYRIKVEAQREGIILDGLVLHLDAGNSQSYPGSGTTWADLSGNGNNGTLTNGPTFSSANKGAIAFDGTDDYVMLGTPPTLAGLQVPLTICAWVYPDSLSQFTTIYGAYGATSGSRLYSMVRVDSGILKYYTSTTAGGFQSGGSLTITPSTWQFIAVRVSGSISSPTVTLFRNDISQTFGLSALSSSPNLTVTLRIAGNQANSNESLNGRIPFLTVYNRALSAAEVSQNFNALRGRFGI